MHDSKAGKVEFRVNKEAGMHVPIGKVSFTDEQLMENLKTLMDAIIRLSQQQPYLPAQAVTIVHNGPWTQGKYPRYLSLRLLTSRNQRDILSPLIDNRIAQRP